MADDISKYRRPGSAAAQKKPDDAETGPVPYKAFGEYAGGAQRLWFKRSKEESVAPAYGFLSNITCDADGWMVVGLHYPALPMIVTIRGECLTALTEAIMKGTAAWVQEYDPERFIDPPLGEPIILEIQVHKHKPAAEDLTEH